MPAYYRSALGGFLDEAAPKILWNLAQANASARFPIAPQAIEAWNIQLPVLRNGFSRLIAGHAAATTWGILLEYPIPMIGKRIDAVLLAHDAIFVIETKTGLSPSSAARQVDDYALNLACFHEYSLGKKIVPLVVSGSHVSPSSSKTQFDHLIESCRCVGTAEFGSLLKQLCKEYVDEDEPGIDPAEWDSGRFKPIPPIIDAAVALYSGMDVFEIGHACAAREDLDKTTNALVGAVLESQAALQKTVCFTTGVPGAGKTLVGLNAVHRPEVKNDSLFLSGNGPLVRVLQEALLRDVIEREPRKTKRQAKLEIQAFIHNVHRFTEEYYGDSKKEPKHRVVVFDEAQRAWDAAQNKRKGRPSISEPEMILEVMDRHKDWAVIVALVGNGQEIHRGEAGLAEWGRALARFPHWKVCASPLVLRTDVPLTLRLFETSDITPRKLSMLDALHLKVSTRAIRAQRISDWVDAVLGGRQSEAAAIASSLGTRPVITRDINMARAWLNENRRGRTRAGLAASARAARLRADGMELQLDQRFEWEHWFLDTPDCAGVVCDHNYCNDVRSSSKLEIAATQFEIQGLELDWVGVCWGEDLTWNGEQWVCRRFNDKVWKIVPIEDPRHTYQINGYRVLLTRARQRMIIYVPQPSRHDHSRLHHDLDATARFLIDSGAVEVNRRT